jgi:hypothetical protein
MTTDTIPTAADVEALKANADAATAKYETARAAANDAHDVETLRIRYADGVCAAYSDYRNYNSADAVDLTRRAHLAAIDYVAARDSLRQSNG